MAAGEFGLIDRLFRRADLVSHPFTRLGIGDDASIHAPAAGMELVVSSDSSVQGVHWPEDFPLDVAADRALCSALSDLAAMGAEPLAVWLNVMAPDVASFELLGLGAVAALRRHGVELAGGDSCRSPLPALSVTVCGQLPVGSAMRRDRAQSGDRLYLIGAVGLHALGLQAWLAGEREAAKQQMSITPQLAAGVRLRKLGVRCCIDVSDGLLQDAGHLATDSGVGIEIDVAQLPRWDWLVAEAGEARALQLAAAGGEDYALLFTAPAAVEIPGELAACVGRCDAVAGVRMQLHGEPLDLTQLEGGFDHFS